MSHFCRYTKSLENILQSPNHKGTLWNNNHKKYFFVKLPTLAIQTTHFRRLIANQLNLEQKNNSKSINFSKTRAQSRGSLILSELSNPQCKETRFCTCLPIIIPCGKTILQSNGISFKEISPSTFPIILSPTRWNNYIHLHIGPRKFLTNW